MKKNSLLKLIFFCFCVSILLLFATHVSIFASDYPAPGKGCLASRCHNGIEPIRMHNSQMAQQIYRIGAKTGDPNGCAVCHGGNPVEEKSKNIAHAAPHTTSREARSCASYHVSAKALGYGTHDGRYLQGYTRNRAVDLTDEKGNILSKNAVIQIPAIPDLPMDLDQVVTRDDRQVQTVGHHWPLSSPFPKAMRNNMERAGVCISCHTDVPKGTVSLAMLHKIGDLAGLLPRTDTEHQKLLNRTVKLAAIVEIAGPVILFILLIIFVWFYRKRKGFDETGVQSYFN